MTFRNIVQTTLKTGYKLAKRDLSTGTWTLQKGDLPFNAYTMGTCGTTKWVVDDKVKEEQKKAKINLPSHLIRPPCIPGSQHGGYQTCMVGEEEGGVYCIPCREKYKYPPFSENIEFVPPREQSCWWQGGNACHNEVDESSLGGMTRPCANDIEL